MNSIIIVPYRNRPAHLAQFLSHMAINYQEQHICIVEQYENKPFNRGKLLNVGFLENENNYNYFFFHDVDMLPINMDYNLIGGVVQCANNEIQQKGYLGGVTLFSDITLERVGGYHNDYYHRAEDNEMMFNLKRLGINVIEKPAKFKTLPHKREGPEFDPALWRKAKKPRVIQNQLDTCLYVVTNEKMFGNVRHLVVAI